MSVQQACKPGSVSLHRWKDGGHPSGPSIAERLVRPTRGTRAGHPAPPKAGALLFGLAPGGVYPNRTVTSTTVRSYRTIAPLPLNEGRYVSVALSVASRRLEVIQHPARRSPDFPPLRMRRGDHPAS
jgi:hypothetical protein